MIQTARDARGELVERWRQIDDAAANRPVQSLAKPWPTAPWYHFPVVGPKIDMGTAFIAGPLSKVDPYVNVRSGGPTGQRADMIERALQLHYAKAKYPLQIQVGLDVMQRRGNSVLRATYMPSGFWPNGRTRYPYLKIDSADPLHFIVFPTFVATLDQTVLHGHLSDQTVDQIRKKKESGEYYESVKIESGSATPDELDERIAQDRSGTSPDRKFEKVRYYELYSTLDFDGNGEEKLWLVHYAWDDRQLLSIKPWKYRKSPCVDFFLHQEYNRWYREKCRGANLLGPQYFANDMRNLTVWLSMWTAMKPMFAENWSLPDDVIQAQPAMVYPIERGGQVFTPQGQVDLAAFPSLIQMARDDADIAGKMSANASGVALAGGRRSATEVNRVAAGQDAGVDTDTLNAGFGLSEMAEYVVGDLLYEHFEDWYPWYADALPQGLTKRDFDMPYWYEAQGEVVNATPEAMMQQVALMAQSLQSLAMMDPTILQRYPDLIPGLLRAATETLTLNQKDSLLPSIDEEKQQQQEIMYANALAGGMGEVLSLPMLGGDGGMVGQEG